MSFSYFIDSINSYDVKKFPGTAFFTASWHSGSLERNICYLRFLDEKEKHWLRTDKFWSKNLHASLNVYAIKA